MPSASRENTIFISSAPRAAHFPQWVWLALVALAAVASRAIGFTSSLVFDDYFTVTHPLSTGWAGAFASFAHNQSQSFGSNFYRPVLTVWEEALHHLIGGSAVGWHAAAIFLHVVSALLLFRLVLELAELPALAAAVAVLFAVHPAHVESVGWISAMGDPMMGCFLLLSTVSLLRWLKGGGALWYAASLVAAAGCVLSKETGVVMPLLVLSAACALPLERRVRRLSLARSAPYFILAAGFLLTRRAVLPAFSSPLNQASNAQMIATWPSALLFYLRHMAWPEAVVPFYPLRMAAGFSLNEFWLPLLALIALVALASVILWRVLGLRRALFCVAWTFIPLAPVLMLKVFPTFELVHDRFLYVPLIGFCAALAWLLHEVTRRMEDGRGTRVFLLLVAALALAWCFRSLSESLWWQNDRALFTHAIQITPDNPRALVNLGDAYMKVNRIDEATPLFVRALVYDPANSNASFGLGLVSYRRGDFAQAETYLVRALRLKPRYDEWEYLARTELRLGKLDVAERAARESVAICQGWPNAHEVLGEVLLAKGDRQGAVAGFAEELRLNPASQPARAGLAQAQGNAAP